METPEGELNSSGGLWTLWSPSFPGPLRCTHFKAKREVPSCKNSGRGWVSRTCIFEYGLDIMGLITTKAIGCAAENVNAGELHRTIQRAQFFRLVMQVASHRVVYQTSIFGGVRFKRDWFCQVEDVFCGLLAVAKRSTRENAVHASGGSSIIKLSTRNGLTVHSAFPQHDCRRDEKLKGEDPKSKEVVLVQYIVYSNKRKIYGGTSICQPLFRLRYLAPWALGQYSQDFLPQDNPSSPGRRCWGRYLTSLK